MKVATLLPSATDMVLALGQQEHLVGVSHSCDLPQTFNHLPRLTSTLVPSEATSEGIDSFVRSHLTARSALYELDVEALETCAADVIVSQGLCDVCAVATGDVLEAVASLSGSPTLVDLNPNTLEDILQDVERVGEALGCEGRSSALRESLENRIAYVQQRSDRLPAADRPSVAFLEWLTPVFNGGHWNPQIVELAGASEVFGNPGQPSTTKTMEQLVALDPNILVVACCGYRLPQTFADLNILRGNSQWMKLSAVRTGRVFVADGQDYFARPSPSIVDALERLAVTLHPTEFPGIDVEPFQRIS